MSVLSQDTFDFDEDTLNVLTHIVVPDSENYEPLPLEELRPSRISVLTTNMAFAVDLDHEPAFQAHKVDDVRADRKLAPKLVTADLPVFDVAPKPPLRFCQLMTQSASA